jgi:hypothetical protein
VLLKCDLANKGKLAPHKIVIVLIKSTQSRIRTSIIPASIRAAQMPEGFGQNDVLALLYSVSGGIKLLLFC